MKIRSLKSTFSTCGNEYMISSSVRGGNDDDPLPNKKSPIAIYLNCMQFYVRVPVLSEKI